MSSKWSNFLGKRQNLENYFNHKFFMWSILENNIYAALRSKGNALDTNFEWRSWKDFLEKHAIPSKLFKCKVFHSGIVKWGYQDNFKPVYLFIFFYKKISRVQKHSQANINRRSKNKRAKNSKCNNFLLTKTSKGW